MKLLMQSAKIERVVFGLIIDRYLLPRSFVVPCILCISCHFVWIFTQPLFDLLETKPAENFVGLDRSM
jgi:hypothetical protein